MSRGCQRHVKTDHYAGGDKPTIWQGLPLTLSVAALPLIPMANDSFLDPGCCSQPSVCALCRSSGASPAMRSLQQELGRLDEPLPFTLEGEVLLERPTSTQSHLAGAPIVAE